MTTSLHQAISDVSNVADKLQTVDDTLSREDAVKEAFQILKEVAEEKKEKLTNDIH